MNRVITGTIHQGDFDALKGIMRDQSSCRRYAYQRIHKDGLSKANDVVKACKPQYMDKLNQRYIQDAVLRAKAMKQEHCLFGGKKNWRKFLSGLITKDQWHEIRDSELYSRGDRTKKGNPNIRVLRTPDGYRLRVGLSKPREFLTFKLYIPEKFQQDFDLHGECYDVRIKAKAGKFYVYIGLDIPDPTPIYGFGNGAIGIDTNPDGLAVVEIDAQGNMVQHQYLGSQRILFARSNKRRHDIEALALQVVNQAVQALDRQKARLLEYCVKKRYPIEQVFDEVGSGMNDSRSKLHQLMKLVFERKISLVIIEHKDRLSRFNYNIFKVCFESYGVEIECVENKLPKSFEDELVDDMLTLRASFSAKIYGKRGAENRKKRKSYVDKN